MKKNKDISPNNNKVNRFSRTLNINKNRGPIYKSKSNKKIDMKTTKPIKIKKLKSKPNLQQIKNSSQNKNENKEKEIDGFLEDYLDKDIIQSINSNKKIQTENNKIMEKNNYIKINNKTSNRIIKNIKNQLISNNIKNNVNIRNNNQLINGGNDKNIHGKLNLNITLNNKSPIRLRKINTHQKFIYGGMNSFSTNKKEKQVNNIYVNNHKNLNMDLNMHIFNTDLNTINNEESSILTLQEEIENIKRENLYKEMVINDMKKQLDNIKKDKLKYNGNFISNSNNMKIFKPENDNINDKIHSDIINSDLLNIGIDENMNKEEANLFDKLKTNYLNNKKIMNDLKLENEKIKNKLNNKNKLNGNKNNSNIYLNKKQKIISLDFLRTGNSEQYDYCKDDYLIEDINLINDYLTNKLMKENNRIYENNNLEKNYINENNKNVKQMISMTLNSNFIPEEEIISLIMNNLINYSNTIEVFISKYLKTNNNKDKEIVQDFFKNIYFDDNNKININKIYKEIKSFYEEDIKNLKDIIINEFFSMKTNKLVLILKECKNIDSHNTGLIELNQFQKILNKYNFYKEFSEDENKIYNILIYNMKKNINFEQIGLFELKYINLFDELGLNNSFIKDNSSENNSIVFEKNEHEKKNSLFNKSSEKKGEQHKIIKEKNIQIKITSNVDFKQSNNMKERGSGNSNNTYGFLSSNKYSFDYSSKSGSKEACSLKEGIKEATTNYMKSEQYLITFCKEYVDNIFKICLNDIKRKTITFYKDYIIKDT